MNPARLGSASIASIAAQYVRLVAAAIGCSGCASGGSQSGGCTTDQNGVQGGHDVVFLTVSDTTFAVGSADSGSTQTNITTENSVTVTLTLNNVGSKPHDFVLQCQPTPNGNGCPMQSCFPPEASLPVVQPGQSATTTFMAPFKEGAYQFISDVPGDTQVDPDGGISGLVGEFLLM